jgi:hypothetical protein|tara:strand:- start:3682 stop:6117 length:2436 start_codon:yes stop_codon:yes gene_type:complete
MSNPLKLRTHANGVYNNGVQVTTNAELDYSVKLINTKYATESGSGDHVGDLNINSTGTSVGTFVDNFATGELLSHPYSGSAGATTYIFKQNVSSLSEASMITPATHGGTSNPGHVAQQTSTQLNTTIMQLCLDDIAKANSTYAAAGSYYVSVNAPSIGGTWVAQDQFFDEVTNNANDEDQKVTYKLWRKTSHTSSPTQVKLLKQSTTNLQEMSDTEIQTLVARLRNRIVATGVGTYKFQTSIPGVGTWVARGAATDRNPNIENTQYTGNYTAQYANTFARQFQRIFSDQYSRGQFARQYADQFQRVYAGSYGRSFARGYISNFARGVAGTNYDGPQYTRVVAGPSYARSTPGPQYASAQFQRAFTRQYAGQYARTYSSQFQRQYARGDNYAVSFTGAYSRGITYAVAYLLVYYGQYARSIDGPNYTVNYTRTFLRRYTNTYSVQYARNYSAQYQRQYARVYSADYTRAAYQRFYAGQYGRTYIGQYDQNYSTGNQFTGLYAGIAPGFNFSNGFFRTVYYFNVPESEANGGDGRAYFRGSYNRGPIPVNFIRGQFTRFFSRSFSRATGGPQYTRSVPSLSFNGPAYARSTPGPQYDGPQYARSRAGPQYQSTFTRDVAGPQYDGPAYSVSYLRNYTAQYARTRNAPQYARIFYTRTFAGSRSYGAYGRQFTGPQYAGLYARAQYTRSTVGPNYNGPTYLTQYTRVYTADYARSFSAQYQRQFARQFVGAYSVTYARSVQYTVNFARSRPGPQYTGNFIRGQFTGQYTRSTPGSQFASSYSNQFAGSRNKQYSGLTVSSNYTENTKTLWLRIA